MPDFLRKLFDMIKKLCVVIVSLILGLAGCKRADEGQQQAAHSNRKVAIPEWTKNATIYELNVRQYTPEGTFNAVRPHLSRLAAMGVDIIWIMPVHPISVTKRKGTLGSYYAVSDFREVNPEFGTLWELQRLMADIRNHGMKVIIDWVPHHTGWDHTWIKTRPDFYSKDADGNIIDPINEETGEPWGWTDVAELKLDNMEMRRAMIADMKYWVEEIGVDGFRVDHAHGLPDDYWDQVMDSLATLRTPLFLLAEAEETRMRNTQNFEVTYAWKFHHAMNDVAQGKRTVGIFDTLLMRDRETYTHGYHMYFTSNHDENSWAGTEMERMGDGHKAFAVLSATIDGMPLIYSGQEEPLRKRLEFFEKDEIPWKDYAYADFYKTLFQLKKRNRALWNGVHGGLARRVNAHDHVYAYVRDKDDDKIVVILNLSAQPQVTTLTEATGMLRDAFQNIGVEIAAGTELSLEPWEYRVLSSK